MIFAIAVWLIMLFILEVKLGSSLDVYNAEIGYEAQFDRPTCLSMRLYFTELLPFCVLFVITPLVLLSAIS